MVDLALEAAADSGNVNFAYIYGKDSDNYKQLKNIFETELQSQQNLKYQLLENKIGTVLSSHTGPLVYGIVIYRGELLGK
jgi:hypothetical protein